MYHLTNREINQVCSTVEVNLAEKKTDAKERIRLRLMLEEVLLSYQNRLGQEQSFSLQIKRTLGRLAVIVRIPSVSWDPFAPAEDGDGVLLRQMSQGTAGAPVWSYKNGVNTITFTPKGTKRFSSAQKTLFTMTAAVIAGMLCLSLPASARNALLEGFVTPTLSAIMGLITAVAGPLIFLSLTWGLRTIGDVDTLSLIGKRMIVGFMNTIALLTVVASLICYPFFESDSGGKASFQVSEFYQLLLGMIPGNLFSPFLSGNTAQIIFLAMVGGIVLLLLDERAGMVSGLVDQCNTLVQYVMSLAGVLIPPMVFLSIIKVILSGQFSMIARSCKMILAYVGISFLLLAGFCAAVAVRQKVRLLTLVRKAMPVFVLAMTTASSAAALGQNMECCEKAFGIDKKIVNFGVPLGQTLFKPGGMVRFVCIGFGLAELYGVAITPNWLTMVIVTCFLLAISAPPVAGGATVCFAILFEQLGVPAEAIGIALSLNVFFDFLLTGVNIFCLQMELIGLADSLHMLDREVLRRGE